MSEDPSDERVGGGWSLDPDLRGQMRLARIRAAVESCAWTEAILEAEELLDEQPDHPEALFLLGESLLETGDWELARHVYDHRTSLDGGDVASLVGVAVSAFHGGDLPASAEAAREAARRDPGNAEAHYFLGLALERVPGRQGEALSELAAAAQLDGARFPLPVSIAPAEWAGIAAEARSRLPGRLRELLDSADIRVEELPPLGDLQRADGALSPTVGALIVGEPPEGDDPFDHPPKTVRIFTRNLARAGTLEAATAELVHALREEALDWVGLDLEQLEAES